MILLIQRQEMLLRAIILQLDRSFRSKFHQDHSRLMMQLAVKMGHYCRNESMHCYPLENKYIVLDSHQYHEIRYHCNEV